jgi:beta-galactosidase
VKVDNSRQPNSRWYSGSGIYRHTWLTAVNPIHVAQWGTFVTTPRVAKEAATVNTRTRVRNDRNAAAKCTLASAILDREGKAVQSNEVTQEIGANGEYEFAQQFAVIEPSLWSVSAPNLYTLRSTVTEGGQVADEYETAFGIREALFDADKGFLLNGEHVKLNGVCLHHDGGSVGAAVPERVWERRFEILREMGCNAIRTSHNPPAPEFLDLCDRMGFLVMDEAFDEWVAGKGQLRGNGYSLFFAEWHERDVTDFVHRDGNHPSVVLWSCGNEIPDQLSPHGVEIVRDMVNIFHREDPTRFVTAACDQIAAEPKPAPVEFLSLLDVVGYNYADRWRERRELYYSEDKLAHPNWRMIGTESGGMGGRAATIAAWSPSGSGTNRRRRRQRDGAAAASVLAAASAGSTPRSSGDSSAPTTTSRATSCGPVSTTWANPDGPATAPLPAASIAAVSPKTATTSTRANGPRNPWSICFRTGIGRAAKASFSPWLATPIATTWSCF